MTEHRFQHLSEAFNSIISMMLASLRARGLRGLLDLPQTIMVAIYLRRIGREFAALLASIDLSGIDLSALPPPVAAAPVQPPPAQPVSTPGALPRPLAHRPRARSGARRAHRPAFTQPISVQPTRQPAFTRRRAPDPRAHPGPTAILRDRAPREAGRSP